MQISRIETIQIVLEGKKKGMHVREIAGELLKRGLETIIPDQEKLTTAVTACIISDIQRHKRKSKFRAISNGKGGHKRGWYGIKDIIVNPTPSVKTENTQYIGKAGEHAVMSELLFLGFNTSIGAIDEGIDIVAEKHKKFFFIQVKTSNLNKDGAYRFSIKTSQFDKFSDNETFYIFVARGAKMKNDYVVVPSVLLKQFIASGFIKSGEKLNITITSITGKVLLNGQNVNWYRNNFDILK